MKRFFNIFVLLFCFIYSFLVVGCVTTESIPLAEYGLKSDDYSGEIVVTSSSGVIYTGRELYHTCVYAEQHNYKYIVVLDKNNEKNFSGVSYNSMSETYTANYIYTGSMIAYIFSSESEYEMFLNEGIGVKEVSKYSKKKKKF